MLFIPQNIKVGYNSRRDTYTGKLAYVIYYDEKGVLRKYNSWSSWMEKELGEDDFENIPTSGFVINRKVGGHSTGWNHRQTYARVHDPRGFEIEINVQNLLYILDHCTSTKGKGLEGEFVYAWDGKDLLLLPVDSPDYKKSKESCDALFNKKKITVKDLVIGNTYSTKNKGNRVYLGRHKGINGENYHVFYNENRLLNSMSLEKGASLCVADLGDYNKDKLHVYMTAMTECSYAFNELSYEKSDIVEITPRMLVKSFESWINKGYSYYDGYNIPVEKMRDQFVDEETKLTFEEILDCDRVKGSLERVEYRNRVRRQLEQSFGTGDWRGRDKEFKDRNFILTEEMAERFLIGMRQPIFVRKMVFENGNVYSTHGRFKDVTKTVTNMLIDMEIENGWADQEERKYYE